jgi:hypothetical protein
VIAQNHAPFIADILLRLAKSVRCLRVIIHYETRRRPGKTNRGQTRSRRRITRPSWPGIGSETLSPHARRL